MSGKLERKSGLRHITCSIRKLCEARGVSMSEGFEARSEGFDIAVRAMPVAQVFLL
jgi:hypothetical protein